MQHPEGRARALQHVGERGDRVLAHQRLLDALEALLQQRTIHHVRALQHWVGRDNGLLLFLAGCSRCSKGTVTDEISDTGVLPS